MVQRDNEQRQTVEMRAVTKALAIVWDKGIQALPDGSFLVASYTKGAARPYRVEGNHCPCLSPRKICHHILAARIYREHQERQQCFQDTRAPKEVCA